ncbi:MAG: hypothetical protein PUD43_01290 [Clostridia bacterium]|nr:hypothetical protein [Clostridia bacterium]
MKSLETIQKAFRVFRILSKIAMIISFVSFGLALLGVICSIIWGNGGAVFGTGAELTLKLTETSAIGEMTGMLIADAVFALTDGILFLYAYMYFSMEQKDGTPFTKSGADFLRKLGIMTIVLPIIAGVVYVIVHEFIGTASAGDYSNEASVTLGVVLIIVSLVLRYGADLEEQNNNGGTKYI